MGEYIEVSMTLPRPNLLMQSDISLSSTCGVLMFLQWPGRDNPSILAYDLLCELMLFTPLIANVIYGYNSCNLGIFSNQTYQNTSGKYNYQLLVLSGKCFLSVPPLTHSHFQPSLKSSHTYSSGICPAEDHPGSTTRKAMAHLRSITLS